MPTSVPADAQEFLDRPRTDLAAELVYLRAENAALRAKNLYLLTEKEDADRRIAELVQTVTSLASALAQARLTLPDSMTRAPLYIPLPHEILLSIFRLTQPDPYSCSPSIVHGPRNPWLNGLRTKKALTLVCHTWSAPATTVLYEEVVLRRVGQIVALAHTLRSDNSSRLATLVQSIEMNACAVWPACADVAEKDLAYTLERCENLTAFSFVRHFELPFVHFSDGTSTGGYDWPEDMPSRGFKYFNPTWFLDLRPGRVGDRLKERLMHGLRTLSIDLDREIFAKPIEHRYLDPFLSLLTYATSLTSLVIRRALHVPESTLDMSSLPRLHFPVLDSLHLHIDQDTFSDYVRIGWKMPELTKLTLIRQPDDTIIPLLEAHGSKLTYLALKGTRLDVHCLPLIVNMLPVISHLAVWLGSELHDLEIHSTTIQFLDIFSDEVYPSAEEYQGITVAQCSRAPSLQNIRLIGHGIGPNTTPYYPMLCDPALLHGEISEISGSAGDDGDWIECTTGGIVYRFEGDIVRQKWWCVVTDPRAYGESAEDSAEEDNLSEYEYESQPESPEDSSASCTESESDGALSELESRPLDHDALLDMFRRGLEGDYLLILDDEHSDGSSGN